MICPAVSQIRLASHQIREMMYGQKIQQGRKPKGGKGDEGAQGGDAEKRPFRTHGKEPQAGHRNWTFRGAQGGQESAQQESAQKEISREITRYFQCPGGACAS